MEETIQVAFDDYPSLFAQRWQVLDHLFCVIGNGFDWIDGELVELGVKKRKKIHLKGEDGRAYQDQQKLREKRILEKKALYSRGGSEEVRVSLLALAEKFGDSQMLEDVRALYNPSDERMESEIEEELKEAAQVRFAHVSPTSFIFTLPPDIKPDWLEGAKEILSLMLEVGIEELGEDANDYQREQRELAIKAMDEQRKVLGL
jgi:hypothetical protein